MHLATSLPREGDIFLNVKGLHGMFEAVFGAKWSLVLATAIEGLLLTTVAATSRAHAGPLVGVIDAVRSRPVLRLRLGLTATQAQLLVECNQLEDA